MNTNIAYSYSQTKRNSYYGGVVALGSPEPSSPFFDASWTPERGFGTTTDHLHFFDFVTAWNLNDTHRFTFGTQFKYEALTDKQVSTNRSLDESFTNIGLFAQHRYSPTENWIFEYGARIDSHSEVDSPIFSPRAAFLYTPTDEFKLRTAISTGFRAPEVFDEDLHISNVGGELTTTFNDPNLKEESSITLSLSPEWHINDTWRLEMNAFHTWLEDTLVVEPNDDPTTLSVVENQRANGESSRVYGAEFNLLFTQPSWQVEFSWVEQRLKYENPQLILGDPSLADPDDNPIFSDRYSRVPESLGLLKFTYNSSWFDLFVTGKVTGPMDIPRVVSNPTTGDLENNTLEKSDWFFNVDIGLSKEFEIGDSVLTASIGVKNLFDSFQDDLEQGNFRNSDYVYGPAFSRTIYTGLKYEF